MTNLDLSRHTPHELAGKTVQLRGREYRIGDRFRESEQGYAHQLINLLSGLCLHGLQVRFSYVKDPAAAREGSLQKERLTAQLRTSFLASGQHTIIPVVSCHLVLGGTIELHEVGPGFLVPLLSSDVLHRAGERIERGDRPAALAELSAYLEQQPHDTVVLERIALLHLEDQRWNEAVRAIERAIDIEPNLARYRGTAMQVGFSIPAARAGIQHFQTLRRLYPEVRDYDAQALQGLLHCGEPELAADLLKVAVLANGRQEVERAVEQALAQKRKANAEATEIGELVKRGPTQALDPALLQKLRRAHERYPDDARLRANLGLLLRAHGELEEAAMHLLKAALTIDPLFAPTCWANAGFAKLGTGKPDEAIPLFEAASVAMQQSTPEQAVWDAPGATLWLDANSAVETYAPSAADLMDAADCDHPGWSTASATVQQLSGLYRQARDRLATPPAGGVAQQAARLVQPTKAAVADRPTLQRLVGWLKKGRGR